MNDSAGQFETGVRGSRSERGVALIMVMSFLALMLLLGLAVSMASITDLDVRIGGAENHDAPEGDWASRKANALKAYYEWMPIREPARGRSAPTTSAARRSRSPTPASSAR